MSMIERDDLYGRLAEVWQELSPAEGEALSEHLLGGTSADRLSEVLTEAGHPIGATTIKRWRRRMVSDCE